MLILFIVQLVGYWIQTDWSGGDGQYSWEDTSRYLTSENMDAKIFHGELRLFNPSGEWENFSLQASAKRANAIVETDPGVLYIGCGWDSARVFKFGDFGNLFISTSNLGVGQVLSLLFLHDQNILVGTSNGKLYRGKDTLWTDVANFGTTNILEIYQPPDFDWIYLGTTNGKIWVDETGSGQQWNYSSQLPNTNEVFDIFESYDGIFYACTKSSNDTGRVFWSNDDGEHWSALYSFSGTEAVYSICETSNHNLYVSTGFQGKIFMSSDSGKHWQEINSPWSPANFYHIFCDSNDILYVGGKCTAKIPKGMIFRSKDSGQTWDTLFSSENWHPSQFFSLMQSRVGFIFAGGDTGVVFRSGYCPYGWLESSVYDVFEGQSVVNKSLEFGRIHFTADGNSVGVRVRSSDILDSMPAWGSYVPNDSNPVNYGSAYNEDRYIQYRVEFTSSSAVSTPVMQEIFLRYKIDCEGPIIDSAVAYDGDSANPAIDDDDYIILWFNEPTDTSRIETSNIDEILRLSNGHSWRSDSGRGVIKYPGQWISSSILKIYLSTLRMGAGQGYPPTIAVGDTICPDSITIKDKWSNACFSPRIIRGRFGIEETTNRPDKSGQTANLEVYPNPFIHKTTIVYKLISKQVDKGKTVQEGHLSTYQPINLSIYDLVGRLVTTLVDEEKPAGLHSVKFQGVGSGIYFVRLKVGQEVYIQKLINFNH